MYVYQYINTMARLKNCWHTSLRKHQVMFHLFELTCTILKNNTFSILINVFGIYTVVEYNIKRYKYTNTYEFNLVSYMYLN